MVDHILPSHYNLGLVFLSVLIGITACYVALDLFSRTAAARTRQKTFWLSAGAVAMGIGIWAMHYIGMLAFNLPVPVEYDLPTVAISLAAAIFTSAVALFIVGRPRLGAANLIWGSLVMGGGICAMHYIGMQAMRLPGHCHYDARIVTLSVFIAVIISVVALGIAFRLRDESRKALSVQLGSAVVMGLAISAMHYTGMAAVCFRAAPPPTEAHYAVSVSSLGVVGITVVTFLVLFLAFITAVVDRHFALQNSLLEAAENEYRVVIENNLAGFCRTAWDGHILDVNQPLLTLLGYKNRDELIGSNVSALYDSSQSRSSVLSRLAASNVLTAEEMCFRRKDGTPVWVIGNITLRHPKKGSPPEIVSMVIDVSQMKKAQQELVLAKELAESASRLKTQFLTNMSHELRTPLNGMLGMTELALACDLSDDVREYLELSKLSAHTLLNLVNDVLDASNFELQAVSLRAEAFNPKFAIESAVQAFAGPARNKGLDLRLDNPVALPESVIGDPRRFQQILGNLLGNAIKFTPNGSVVVKVEEAVRQDVSLNIHISVRDTGIGIPSDQLGLIFDAFSQVDSSNTRRYGGLGLGLAITSQLVRAMQGRIWVESSVGAGSAFHVVVKFGLTQPANSASESLARDASLTPVNATSSI